MALDKHEHPEFTMFHGDCIPVMRDDMNPNSVDLAIFSPPFSQLYAYNSSDSDMGNSKDHSSDDEFLLHFDFAIDPLFKTMKPGCNVCVHCADLPRLKEQHGYIGAYDFPGDLIRIMEKHGFIYYRRWTINKNPQSQSIRHHSITLTFTQFEKDSRQSAAALADYVLVFRKPGIAVPVKPQCSRDEWIEWANPTWYGKHESSMGIQETDTLNTRAAKCDNDERHICPLQLSLIDRLVRLYTNEGETVFTPFMGIGSEVYQSLLRKRHGVGIELKKEWFHESIKNALGAIKQRDAQLSLFSMEEKSPNV